MSLFLLSVEGELVVHCHIPKTGGTSIRLNRQLSTCRLYTPDKDWLGLPSFSVVRDPYDRAVSCWKDFTYLRPQTDMAFEPWLMRMHRLFDSELVDNPQTMVHHASPQTHPVHGLQHAKVILRSETLQNDWGRFCESLGVRGSLLSREKDSSEYPDPVRNSQIESLVREMYGEDYDFIDSL